ncbi:MAG TPA: 2-hydroxyacid dehydrogenase [Burkholderiaceae bacterium]|nr:2-hydroxyacid dehydrogenase [Burkholderiaceae bacterium]HSB99219.1 2-hydroxyacid dehydrogenase [Burkholderiaceae bacterium]
MKHKVLQYGRLMPSLEKQLAEAFDRVRLVDQSDPRAWLREHGREVVGLATAGFADAALIDALPSLKVISSFGVGVDKIDLDAAARRGIPVGNTPDVLNDCVADLAIGLMIDVARGIGASERYLRAGSWPKGAYPLQHRFSGKKLGILGLGRIGHAIAKRALAFDMDIRYHNRRPVTDTSIAHEPSLVELARWCDFLVVIVPGGAATHHLINEAVLNALGPKGYLINVARGSVVDEPALVRALQDKRIAGAALDVFEHEPQVPAELMALDSVVLVPHIGSATVETRAAMAQRVFDNLASYFDSGKLISQATA